MTKGNHDERRAWLKWMGVVALLFLAPGLPAQDIEAGRQLFITWCATCHGPDGDGNGPAAGQLILKPRDFALAAFKFDTDADWEKGTDQDLANVIRQGTAVFGGASAMPAWGQFSDAEIASLIRYIRSLEEH